MDQIKKLYYDPEEFSSYGGARRLYSRLKEIDPKITENDVKKWLRKELTYTLHKPIRFKFKRNKVVAFSHNEQWQADLADMKSLSRHNLGYKYILTMIDVFSKYGFAKPIKNKTPKEIIRAFQEVFSSGFKPLTLQTDRGTEFVNQSFHKFLKLKEIKFFTSKNQTIKCSVVERFNRSLKNRLYRYFTAKGTSKWVDVLQDFVDSYNKSFHRSIKMAPIDVTEENRSEVFRNLYGVSNYDEMLGRYNKPNLLIGDSVRVSKAAHPFRKGYLPSWSEQIFNVNSNKFGSNKNVYEIKDEDGEIQQKTFYPEELQLIYETPETTYRVEKILARKMIAGIKHCKIKWMGLPTSFNSWIPETEIISLSDVNH
jgi:transposase InsO family protein